jgi:hypothetical protein
MALAGLYEQSGFGVFRHRFEKHANYLFRQVCLFASTCVRKTILILDDLNAWARSEDIQRLAKLVAGRTNICVIATAALEDSEDGARLQAVDLPGQALTFAELKPAVVEAMLNHEGEIVSALKTFQARSLARPLGLGYLDSPLKHQIQMLGSNAKTVYEFIFALRSRGAAVADELKLLCEADRSDLPILHLAIEQIGGFEKPAALEDIVEACRSVESSAKVPPVTRGWIEKVLEQQVRDRRVIRVRSCYTTIHRKWAANLIAAGLNSPISRAVTEAMLKPNFAPSGDPGRLLRLWSYLSSLDESRPYTKFWERSLTQDDWTTLVRNCAEAGLEELGAVADRMHLLKDGPAWKNCVGEVFQACSSKIAELCYAASEDDWYSLNEISMLMAHACPDCARRPRHAVFPPV